MLLESMATGWREHVKRGQVRWRCAAAAEAVII
jgi:hypothetical protein